MEEKVFNPEKTIHQAIGNIKESLQKVISSALNVSYETSGLGCNRAQALASDFLTKNTLVSLSIWRIINPQEIIDFPQSEKFSKIHDFPSTYVLLRTLFEGYVNMYYVLIDPQKADEKKLRLIMWDRNACYESEKMRESSNYFKVLIAEEKYQINVFKKLIKQLKMFNELDKEKKQSLLETHKFALNTLETRTKIAGIHKSYYKFFFKLLSNYAHAEPFALRQIHDIKSPQMSKVPTYLQMQLTEMFLSLTLKVFGTVIPKGQTIINTDKILLEIINFWNNFKKEELNIPKY